MTQGAKKTFNKSSEEREFGLGDVMNFLKSNALFIGLLTLLIAAVAVGVALLLPQQYSKQLTLDTTTIPTSLLSELGQPPTFDDTQLGNLAVGYIQSANLEGVSVSPTYNTTTRQVNAALQSGSRDALDAAVPALVRLLEDRFREAYEEPIADILDVRVERLESDIEVNRLAVESLERETRALTGSDPRDLARLEGLEGARGEALADVARSEAEIQDLQEVREDLPRLADEVIAVEVLSESEAPQSRSFMPIVVLALMLGLVLAVVVAIIGTVLRKSA